MNLTSYQIELFWKKVNKTDTCWLWTASVGWNGYGMFGKPTKRAHHVAIHLAGAIINPGEEGLHKCNVKRCVRYHPEHVYVGTPKQNAQDRKDSGFKSIVPWVPGTDNGASKLTEEQVLEIRRLYSLGRVGRARKGSMTTYMIADMFNVSSTQVKRIVNRQTWKHI